MADVQVADNGIDYPVSDAAALGVDEERLDELVARAARDVTDGPLPSCQLAVARHGQLVLSATLGDATPDSRYIVFSCSKALTASSMWLLIGEGLVDIDAPAATYVPEFGANGKEGVTVRHLLTHTGGFPHAPGSRYEYHSTAAHWVLAEIIETISGSDHRDFFVERVATPLGVALTLGAPEDTQHDVRRLVPIGEIPTPEELEALGVTGRWDPGEVVNDNLVVLNEPANMAVGVPGGGGIGTAADLALFYQGVLANPGGLWDPEVLRLGTAEVLCDLDERLMGIPANRTLGLTLAGDDGHAAMRGFGRTVSPGAFGHMGAGGQIAWADPATGISFAYLTDGLDAFVPNQWKRLAALSNRAGALAAD